MMNFWSKKKTPSGNWNDFLITAKRGKRENSVKMFFYRPVITQLGASVEKQQQKRWKKKLFFIINDTKRAGSAKISFETLFSAWISSVFNFEIAIFDFFYLFLIGKWNFVVEWKSNLPGSRLLFSMRHKEAKRRSQSFLSTWNCV